jgi:catechol 2,3-dioxygenase-like lactoylglutathione lyase family enzyme
MAKLVEIALFTDEVERVVEFYRDLLGVEPVVRAAKIAIFDLSGVHLLIHEKGEAAAGMPAGMPPNADHFAFGVRDLDAAAGEATRRGLQLALKPEQYDWGRSAYMRDPDGRLVELSEVE